MKEQFNADKLIKVFNETGICEVDVNEVCKQWSNDFAISQWRDEYTLCKFDPSADNFTKTSLKVKISKQQAKELIVELDLIPEQSPVFNSGKTWRKV